MVVGRRVGGACGHGTGPNVSGEANTMHQQLLEVEASVTCGWWCEGGVRSVVGLGVGGRCGIYSSSNHIGGRGPYRLKRAQFSRARRIGEAKNPGPGSPPQLDIGLANVSALRPIIPWACAAVHDLMVFVETHIPAAGMAAVSGAFLREGWNWAGVPATPGVGKGTKGGLAVVARAPRRLYMARPPIKGPAYLGGYWMRVVVQGGRGEAPVHLVVVYSPPRGMPGHSLTLEEILFEAFEEAARLGEVPVAVLGDFNCEPQDCEFLQGLRPA